MKVIVCGDRKWGVTEEGASTSEVELAASQRRSIRVRIELLSCETTHVEVIVGDALGADSYAELAARSLRLDVMIVKAQWHKYGREAGPIRNQQMLDFKPNLVIAFHRDLLASKGTADMVRRARKAGVTVEVIGT